MAIPFITKNKVPQFGRPVLKPEESGFVSSAEYAQREKAIGLLGGGGDGRQTVTVDTAAAERASAEQARLKQEDLRIAQQTTKNIQDLHTNFKQSIRGVTDINQRLVLVKKLERDIALSKLQGGATKVEAGVIKSFDLYGVNIDKSNVAEAQRGIKASFGEVIQLGKPVITKEEAKQFTPEQLRKFKIGEDKLGILSGLPDTQKKKFNLIEFIKKKSKEQERPEYQEEQEQRKKFEREASYGEVLKRSGPAGIVRKAFLTTIPGELNKVSEFIKVEVFGGRPLTPEEKIIVEEFVGTTLLFMAIGPVIKTGTASIQEVLSKGKFADLGKALDSNAKKELAKRFQDALRGTEANIKVSNSETQLQILKNVFDKFIKTPEQKKNFVTWIQSLDKRGIISARDIAPFVEGSTPQTTIQGIINLNLIPRLKYAGEISGVVTSTGNLGFKSNQERINFSQMSISERLKFRQEQQRKVISLVLPKENQSIKNILGSLSLLNLRIKQATSPATKQALQQRVKQLTKQLTIQKTQLKQQQQQRFKQQQIYRTGLKIKLKPKLKIFIPPLLRAGAISRIKARKKREKGLGYNVFVKSKGKYRKQNKASLSQKHASSLGSYLTDVSTARSFLLKTSGKKVVKPILKIPKGYWEKSKHKFRGVRRKGKIQPINLFGIRIEKSKYAIDTKSEKKGLSLARARAKLFKKVTGKQPSKKIKRVPKPFTKLKKKRRLQK